MAKQELQSLFTADEYKANFKVNKNGKSEHEIQVDVCQYIKKRYPDVIFTSDLASGMNLGAHVGGMNTRLRSSKSIPDVTVYEPKNSDLFENGILFCGLLIELKRDGVKLKRDKDAKKILKDDYKLRLKGDWYDLHIEEQALMHERLRRKFYKVEFACGYDEAIKLIDEYLK